MRRLKSVKRLDRGGRLVRGPGGRRSERYALLGGEIVGGRKLDAGGVV